jgi:hypothetical protein
MAGAGGAGAPDRSGWEADGARRYLEAVYGPDVWFRAPETFGNLVERWIWCVASAAREHAEATMDEICRQAAQARCQPVAEPEEDGHGG